jgi:hypothetical protein
MAKAKRKTNPEEFRAKLVTAAALVALLLIASYALLGPTGILAWAEYRQAINERGKELAKRNAMRCATASDCSIATMSIRTWQAN